MPIIAGQGWQSGGVALAEQHVRWSIHEDLYHWRLFRLLDEQRPQWENGHRTGPDVTSLTVAGRVTAVAYLQARATAPRRDLH